MLASADIRLAVNLCIQWMSLIANVTRAGATSLFLAPLPYAVLAQHAANAVPPTVVFATRRGLGRLGLCCYAELTASDDTQHRASRNRADYHRELCYRKGALCWAQRRLAR